MVDSPDVAVYTGEFANSNTHQGAFAADGTWQTRPDGWLIAKMGLGTYTITHNLNTISYGVNLAVPSGTTQIPIMDANTIEIQCYDGNGNPADSEVAFSVSVY